MDACIKKSIGKIVWLITAAAALAVGLNALGMDTLGLMHLHGFERILRYIVGLCGVMSLVMFFSRCHKSCC